MDVAAIDPRAGQASIEFTGLVLVIAVAMAALALVAADGRWLPREAPTVPFGIAPGRAGDTAPGGIRPFRDALRHPAPDAASPQALRRWYDGAPVAHRTALLGVVAAAGAADEIVDEAADVIRDPFGYAAGRLDGPDIADPRYAARRLRGAPRYIAGIRRLGFRAGSERIAHDAGHAVGRLAIERALGPRNVLRVARRVPDLARRIPGIRRLRG